MGIQYLRREPGSCLLPGMGYLRIAGGARPGGRDRPGSFSSIVYGWVEPGALHRHFQVAFQRSIRLGEMLRHVVQASDQTDLGSDLVVFCRWHRPMVEVASCEVGLAACPNDELGDCIGTFASNPCHRLVTLRSSVELNSDTGRLPDGPTLFDKLGEQVEVHALIFAHQTGRDHSGPGLQDGGRDDRGANKRHFQDARPLRYHRVLSDGWDEVSTLL